MIRIFENTICQIRLVLQIKCEKSQLNLKQSFPKEKCKKQRFPVKRNKKGQG